MSTSDAIAGARAAIFLGTEVAWRIVDVLVAKGMLSPGEARATLYAIADGVRNDVGRDQMEIAEIVTEYLEAAGDRFRAPKNPVQGT
ncbi:hypothetical protein [Mesorhizobium sp. M2A.F.Ca.ET.067.02.1.1]|uniref:hypothetical protein n=1 Tax=Mesorhizobium sp. M2A.F.Ca.ET.067.02.1.1 TaxID=2496749 RepID=UPI000FD4E902|nr:hypothetical protein [Mesorhizobium sp. M2A.F.Ca.ET.067.02.1.1]RUW81493.1 hypothetical protein EOA28_00770 [Mesorhizobium sp. M2A.F.Ca.ET.067.02.1.1]TIU58005.1 MAG: hypothetical protein E5W35_06515 [Mesorhizobium sp.]